MKGFINDIWWMILVRSVALLLFGIIAVVWPGLTLALLALFFAVYVLLSGIADILIGFGTLNQKKAWFITLLLGIIEVGTGVYLLRFPELALATFITTVGVIFMIQGVLTIVTSFVDTTDQGMRLLEILSVILGIIAGFAVFQHPVSGGIAFTWVLGVYGIIAGALGITSALSLRHMVEGVEKAFAPHKAVARG